MPSIAARRALPRRGLYEAWLLLSAFAFVFFSVLTVRADERVIRVGDQAAWAGSSLDGRATR